MSIQKTLSDFQLSLDSLESNLKKLNSSKCDFADIYIQDSESEFWSLENNIVSTSKFSQDKGIGVRTVTDDSACLAYTNIFTNPGIDEAVLQAISMQSHTSKKVLPVKSNLKANKPNLYSSDYPLKDLLANEKVSLLQRVNQAARSITKVTNVAVTLSCSFSKVVVLNTEGVLEFDYRPLIRFGVDVTVKTNGSFYSARNDVGGRYSFTTLSKLYDLENLAKKTVHEALEKENAVPPKAGMMPVVLSNGWPGILLHEAVGHGLEGDAIYQNASTFSNLLGERVASKGVNIYDNADIPNARGSLNIDDEGTFGQKTKLIDDGILVGFMHDKISAKALNTNLTGNGRRQSYAHLTIPRMTNTYMDNGTHNPKDIIQSVSDGIYAENFGGGQVDTVTGNFVFSITKGYEIKNGKLARPLKGATLIGNGADALKEISLIGNDFKLDDGVGTCGKDGQGVPVCVGQPTILLDKITVGGQ